MQDQSFTESNSSMHLYRVLEDEYINLYGPLPAEYPWLFLQSHIKDRPNLIARIKDAKTPLNVLLKRKLDCLFAAQIKDLTAKITEPTATDPKSTLLKEQLAHLQELQKLPAYGTNNPHGKELADALVEVFNDVLVDPNFYQANRPFLGVNIQNDTKRLITEHLEDTSAGQPSLNVICRINRFLLEDAFPDELERRDLDNLEAAHRSYIAAIYSAIHNHHRERAALCLSGGG